MDFDVQSMSARIFELDGMTQILGCIASSKQIKWPSKRNCTEELQSTERRSNTELRHSWHIYPNKLVQSKPKFSVPAKWLFGLFCLVLSQQSLSMGSISFSLLLH